MVDVVVSGNNIDVVTSQAVITGSGTVENTDQSYQETVNSGATVVIPDITLTKNDNTTVSAIAAIDLDLGVIDPFPATWDEFVSEYGRGYEFPIETQTTSYRTGDAASTEATHFGAVVRQAQTLKARNTLADFLTLNNNNSFGNKNRFTYIDGTQVYATKYQLDNYTGIAYDYNNQGSLDFNGHIDAALANSFEGFSDYWLMGKAQLYTMHNSEDGTYGLSLLLNTQLQLSNTNDASTTQNHITATGSRIITNAKTTAKEAVYCRKHF